MAVNQGNILELMQKSARNGTLLSSCEPEVRELMHQIDILISSKQAEWAEQWVGLETQLREKERELAAVRNTLWQRDTELEQIREQMRVSNATPPMTSSQKVNESHVLQLKTELAMMTEKYEQLKLKRHKHSNTPSTVSMRKTAEEIHQLRQENQALESVRVQLERHKSTLEDQLNLAKFETTTLQEKCAALEGEVKFCRSQLDQKTSLITAIEHSSTVRAKQLEAQLKRTQELADSRELALHKIRSECDKRRKEVEIASAETLALNTQLTHNHTTARQLKAKYSELQQQVKTVEDQLKVAGSQLSQRDHTMNLLHESSQRKDELIRSLGGRQGQSSELARLKHELAYTQSQLQNYTQQERRFGEEITTLRQRNASDKQELARITAECALKDEQFAEELANISRKHTTELRELQSQLSKMKQEKMFTTRRATTPSSHPHTHYTSTSITIPTTVSPSLPQTTHTTATATTPVGYSTSNIIEKFLKDTEMTSHASRPLLPSHNTVSYPPASSATLFHSPATCSVSNLPTNASVLTPNAPTISTGFNPPPTITTTGLHTESHTHRQAWSHSQPHYSQPPTVCEGNSRFVPLKPVSNREDSNDIQTYSPRGREGGVTHQEGSYTRGGVAHQEGSYTRGGVAHQEGSYTRGGGAHQQGSYTRGGAAHQEGSYTRGREGGVAHKDGSFPRGGEGEVIHKDDTSAHTCTTTQRVGGASEDAHLSSETKTTTNLEDLFSKNLDNIVDRRFQELDSSLKKLMTKET